MLTKLYPMVQFKKDTWEIDEFDCASMFLLIGTEKAMLIDCGMGIGDLRGFIRRTHKCQCRKAWKDAGAT